MVKRSKRLSTGIESIKIRIEEHFKKLENEINENNEILARYHFKEINRSLITTLEKKLNQLAKENTEVKELLENYRKKLEEYRKRLGMEEE